MRRTGQTVAPKLAQGHTSRDTCFTGEGNCMVRCPYCQHAMELKGAHPGKFTPKCPACKHRFMLLVPEDASIPPLVGEMPGQGPSGEAVAGESHAGLTAAGVNAISATAIPPSATGNPQAAV